MVLYVLCEHFKDFKNLFAIMKLKNPNSSGCYLTNDVYIGFDMN